MEDRENILAKSMPKFRVVLNGTGCQIEVDEGKWLRPKTTLQAVGFYTTRFIDATSVEDAVSKAMIIVQEDLQHLNRSVHPPVISVESVVEDEVGYAKYAPGGGFTWYREDTSASDETKPNGRHQSN